MKTGYFAICLFFVALIACENPLSLEQRKQESEQQALQEKAEILKNMKIEPMEEKLDSAFMKEMGLARAEAFVKIQGYTNAEIDRKDDFVLVRESVETAESDAEILKSRYGTLEPKAIRPPLLKGRVCYVGFRYIEENKEFCRLVTAFETMGRWTIKMEHQDYRIDAFK